MPPNQSPNPFARPSPWGNQPSTRISLAPRPAVGAPPEPVAPEPRAYAAPAMVSGFSTPRPRPRPAAAPTPAPVADPEAFAFDMSGPVERPPLDAVAPMAMEPLLDVGRTSFRPARRRTRRDAPMAAYALGGLAAVAVLGLGVGAALLSHRPVETPSPPPALAPSVPAPVTVATAPAPAPAPAPEPEPVIQASPTLRPVMPRPKSRSAEAVAVRSQAAPVAEPAESAPLLDLRPAQAAPIAPRATPAPVLHPPADPEAPIPTRLRTPD